MSTGWTNYGSGFSTAGYYKDLDGVVHLRGLVKKTSPTNGETIFTLPSGYWPEYSSIFAITSVDLTGEARVLSDGSVLFFRGSGSWFCLDGIQFRAV
jgi:hypothetical protein